MNTLDSIPEKMEQLLTAATSATGNPLEGIKVLRPKWNHEAIDAALNLELSTGKGVVIIIAPVRERRSANSPDGHFEGSCTVPVLLIVNERKNMSDGLNKNPIDLVYAIRKAVIGRQSAGSFLLGQSSLDIEEISVGIMYAQEFETPTQWRPL